MTLAERAGLWTQDRQAAAREVERLGGLQLRGLGRLKPGTSVTQAQEQLRVVAKAYGAATPDKVDANAGLSAVSFHEDLVGAQRPMFLTLLAAVGCVLLVACANVANLVLARATSRRREIALRLAIGATRGFVFSTLIVEAALIAVMRPWRRNSSSTITANAAPINIASRTELTASRTSSA